MRRHSSRLFFISIIISQLLLLIDASAPHIILIQSDDVGWNDFSIHGSKQCQTPHIDELASNGVVLDSYYTQPVCSPSRASLMSGRHVIHTGVYDVYGGTSSGYLNLSFSILPQYLEKAANYSSHIVGKWHLGMNKLSVIPTQRGFESHVGYLTGAEDHFTHISSDNAVDFWEDSSPTIAYDNMWSTEVFTEKAIDIIEKFGNYSTESRPLFLYLNYQDSHWPIEAPQEYLDQFASITNSIRQGVCAMGAHLDDAVYNISLALEANGFTAENTLLIYVNDNGGPTNGDENTNNNNYPLRSGKDSIWEGGVRVLSFVKGFGIKKSGYHNTDYFHVTDWLPTILSAVIEGTGENAVWTDYIPSTDPAFQAGDGLNNWPMISNGETSARDWILLETHPNSTTSRSHGDAYIKNGWKIIKIGSTNPSAEIGWPAPPGEDTTTTNYSVKCGGTQPVASKNDCVNNYCLFDLLNDPCEYRDQSSVYPDVFTELLEDLENFQKTAVLGKSNS